jgi:hypothetical protein
MAIFAGSSTGRFFPVVIGQWEANPKKNLSVFISLSGASVTSSTPVRHYGSRLFLWDANKLTENSERAVDQFVMISTN